MPEQTRLSLMTLHADGTVIHRVWDIPAEAADNLAEVTTATFGEPSESISSADAVKQLLDLDVPGMVTL